MRKMVKITSSEIRQMKEGSSSQIVTLRKALVNDPDYPFKPGDEVILRIVKHAVVIEKSNGLEGGAKNEK